MHEVLFVQKDEFEKEQKILAQKKSNTFLILLSNRIQVFAALGSPMIPLQNMKMNKINTFEKAIAINIQNITKCRFIFLCMQPIIHQVTHLLKVI